MSIMMNKEEITHKVILFFGKIPSTKEGEEWSKKVSDSGLTLLDDEVVYRLIEKYQEFELKTNENITGTLLSRGEAILPAKMEMLKEFLFVKGGPKHFLIGVRITFGKIYKGMRLSVTSEGKVLSLGVIESIQKDKETKEEAKMGDEVCLRISNENHLTLGRQFDEKWNLYSSQSRESIDNLKKYFREILKKEDWRMVIEQKRAFGIH